MPDDPKVVASLRLGWAVSELRGRCRPTAPPGSPAPQYSRPGHGLPVGTERTNAEAAIGTMATITSMATILNLDPKAKAAGAGSSDSLLDQASSITATIASLKAQFARESDSSPKRAALVSRLDRKWSELAECLYLVDAQFQDGIAAAGEPALSGYQVGRALADLYWAVDSAAPDDAVTSWAVVFGEDRLRIVTEGLGRLAPILSSPFSSSAIATSLGIWSKLVLDKGRLPLIEKTTVLRDQVTRFYDVLIGGRDPRSFVQPTSLIRQWRTLGRLVRAFALQLVMLVVAAGIFAWFTVLVASSSDNVVLQTILGLLGGLGVSTAAIQARLKNASQALLKKLRAIAYGDLVAIDFTVPLPQVVERGEGAGPRGRLAARRDSFSARRLVVQTVMQRPLSTPVDL